MQPLSAFVTGENIRRRITLWMSDMQSGAGRVGEHIENVVFWQFAGWRLAVALSKRMVGWDRFIRVPGAKSLLALPMTLPFGLDQMKRILSACHKRGNIAKSNAGNNRG